jgi:hypothetical protein
LPRLATLRALWTDAVDSFPGDNEKIWWEIWLRRHDGRELERLTEFAGLRDLPISQGRLEFDELIITLIQASSNELAASLDVLNDLAEVRRAKESAAVFADMSPEEQADWLRTPRQDHSTIRSGAGSLRACRTPTAIHVIPLGEKTIIMAMEPKWPVWHSTVTSRRCSPAWLP